MTTGIRRTRRRTSGRKREIGLAHQIKTQGLRPITGKEGHVGSVAVVVTGGDPVGDDAALPSGLGVSGKGARIDTARSAAASHDTQGAGLSVRSRGRPCANGQSRACRCRCARIVPRYLGNVSEGGLARRRLVTRAAARSPKCALIPNVVEIRPTHSDVERRRSDSAHSQAMCGDRCVIEIIAAGGTGVSRGNHRSDSLRGCLLP